MSDWQATPGANAGLPSGLFGFRAELGGFSPKTRVQKPTVSSLSDPAWCDINTIVEERLVRDLIPALKQAGATGIVEYPLNKIIP